MFELRFDAPNPCERDNVLLWYYYAVDAAVVVLFQCHNLR